MALQIKLLMILLGGIERGGGFYFRDDGLAAVTSGLRQRLLGFQRQLFLLFSTVEDHGPVLASLVGELPVDGGGIDVLPVNVKNPAIAGLYRIEDDLNRLAVAGPVRGNFFVGRVGLGAARIAHGSGEHSGGLVKGGLHAPKTAPAEGGCLRFLGRPKRDRSAKQDRKKNNRDILRHKAYSVICEFRPGLGQARRVDWTGLAADWTQGLSHPGRLDSRVY